MLLHHHLEYQARVRPGAQYAISDGRVLSYGQAAGQVERLAAALLASGLGVGVRFAILARNRVEIPLLWFAASRTGAVPVPLNFRLAPPEWRWILDDAGARVLFAERSLALALEPVRGALAHVERFVCLDGALDGWQALDDWLALAREPVVQRGAAADDAFQMYTSGTTGRPKGAVLSQQALFTAIYQWCLLYPLAPGDRQLLMLPMYHIAGLQNAFHAAACGASVYMQSELDPAELVRVLDEERIARAPLVPTIIGDLLRVPGAEQRRYATLRFMTYGGAPIDALLLKRALEVFRCDFQQGYGMTEAPCLTYLYPDDHRLALTGRPELLRSVGRAAPGVELRVAGPACEAREPGQVGEICARGPQLMSRYWNQPDASTAALAGGWMHTGDAGYLDAGGYLYLVDRIKDMILSGGENIYPREVENALLEHPAVADVAVVGVPHERWGEAVKAFVVLAPGQRAGEQELIEFCRTRIAAYKRPRSIRFSDSLPRNASGKVLKRVLRAGT